MTPSSFSTIIGDEVYVYVLGRLVMKRWLLTGRSVTFHIAPFGTRWN